MGVKMHKVLLIIIVLCVSTMFAITYDGLTEYLKENTNMTASRIKEVLDGIYDQIGVIQNKYSTTITPEMMVSIMMVETNGRNILGDNGNSIGYFQLQFQAIWYVWEFFPELKKDLDTDKLLSNPKYQAQLATSYLFLMYRNTDYDLHKAIERYNGGGDPNYLVKYISYYKQILTSIKV